MDEQTEEKITVLIVEDNRVLLDTLRSIVEGTTDMDVVGVAGSGEEAIPIANDYQPDVVLMDIQLPKMNGIEATRLIRADCFLTKVLILTEHDDSEFLEEAMRAGAHGYLIKGVSRSEILRRIRDVHEGGVYFSPKIAGRLLEILKHYERPVPAEFKKLSRRQFEVLELMAQGRSNGDIATALEIAPHTVANHVSNVLAKLHVYDRDDAMRKAWEAGLVNKK